MADTSAVRAPRTNRRKATLPTNAGDDRRLLPVSIPYDPATVEASLALEDTTLPITIGMPGNLQVEPTLTGIAEAVGAVIGERVRYAVRLGVWMAFDGVRWRPVPGGRRQETMSGLVHTAMGYLMQRTTSETLDKAFATVRARELGALVTAMAGQQALQLIAPFTRDSWGVVDASGTWYDLRSNATRPVTPEDLNVDALGTTIDLEGYARDGTPVMDGILGIQGHSVAAHETVWEHAALGMIPDIPADPRLMVHYGPGSTNGKTKFVVNGIGAALGSYGIMASRSIFTETGNDSKARSDLMRLEGKRFAIIEELCEGHLITESAIKDRISSTRQVLARGLFEAERSFASHVSYMATTNHPLTTSDSQAYARRIILVTYPVSFRLPGDPVDPQRPLGDPDIEAKIAAELPRIAARLLVTARRMLARPVLDVQVAPELVAAFEEHRAQHNLFEEFLATQYVLEPRQANAEVQSMYFTDLRKVYLEYCKSERRPALAAQAMKDYLKRHGKRLGVECRKSNTWLVEGVPA